MTRTRKDIVEAIRLGMGAFRHDAGAALEAMLKLIIDARASKSITEIRTLRETEKKGQPFPKRRAA